MGEKRKCRWLDLTARFAFGICGVALYLRLANVPCYDPLAGSRLERARKTLLDPDDPRVLVCAHRGGKPPENSLSAIARAIAMKADIVEIDTAETADGHIVLFHDSRVDRTTDGRGRIAKMTLAKVRKLRLSKSMIGESPPTLEMALRFSARTVFLCLDMKRGDPAKIVDIVRREGAMDRVVFYGNDKVLAAVRTLAPEAVLMARIRKASELESVMTQFQPRLIRVERSALTRELSARIRAARAKPWVNSIGWTDYRAFANLTLGYGRLLACAPGVIQTDEPQMVREFILRRNMAIDDE